MKTKSLKWILAGLFTASSGLAWAVATVAFTNPDAYVDIPSFPSERAQIFKEISDHFSHLAEQLPPGQNLKIEILDIDLAGRVNLGSRYGSDLRVLRGGADWPHIHLRYTLEADGKVLASGDDHLTDMMYLDHGNNYRRDDVIRYEKQMIDIWFKEKFLSKNGG